MMSTVLEHRSSTAGASRWGGGVDAGAKLGTSGHASLQTDGIVLHASRLASLVSRIE